MTPPRSITSCTRLKWPPARSVEGGAASILLGQWPAEDAAGGAGDGVRVLPLAPSRAPLRFPDPRLSPGAVLDEGRPSCSRHWPTWLPPRSPRRACGATPGRPSPARRTNSTLLRRAGLLISSRTGLQDTLDTILQMALEVTGARYGIFRLVDGVPQRARDGRDRRRRPRPPCRRSAAHQRHQRDGDGGQDESSPS